MASYYPPIGTWFRDMETGQTFEIVAIDDRQNTIEVQFSDGDIDEFDIESWGRLNIIQTEAPEDIYVGLNGKSPFSDDISSDFSHSNLNPLEFIEADSLSDFDDLY